MAKAHFIFTKLANSFSVHVRNLEELSVEEIQAIEAFVKVRNGFFDFNTYSFVIQKRVDFYEFSMLVKNSFTDVLCEEKEAEVKKDAKIEFGKYKGMPFSRLPDSYLLWLKSNYKGKSRDIIEAELNRISL